MRDSRCLLKCVSLRDGWKKGNILNSPWEHCSMCMSAATGLSFAVGFICCRWPVVLMQMGSPVSPM